MALVMPSRFACLKIEDDDLNPSSANKSTDKKSSEIKQSIKKNTKNLKKTVTKQQSSKPTSHRKKIHKSTEQWEQWKLKDNELVDDHFKEELCNAILLSKLEYEENQNNDLIQKSVEKEQKVSDSIKKNKKKKSMSLEQFKTMVSTQPISTDGVNLEKSASLSNAEQDKYFFERINSEAREEFSKDKCNELLKARVPYNDAVTISQFQAELEKERAENTILRQELDKARKEIVCVRERNKKLCSILQQGEMRDKAEIITEVERLERVQEELTSEVSRLYEQLEQERSKLGSMSYDSKNKDKLKVRKNVRFNASCNNMSKK